MAMIDQVDITEKRYFEMMPKIGEQVIKFGDASDADAKFEKLKLFYKKIMTQVGWNRYSVINLQYNNQVVAKIRGKDDVSEDSLRTVQMMEIIAANAARMAEDSARMLKMQENNEGNTTDVSMIQESVQRDDEPASESTTTEKTNATPKVIAPPKPQEKNKQVIQMKKPGTQKPTVKPQSKPIEKPVQRQPKITMPRQNDY
jgi:cell division protein FtsQ